MKCVNNQVRKRMCEIMRVNERMKKCVNLWGKTLINMLVNKWIIWLNDWLSCVALTLRWIEVMWGEWVRGRERASEWLWCMVAENDHFVNVRSSLDRVLTTQFDWLEVSLAWNCIEYVFADQYIICHCSSWPHMIWFQVWIWFEHPYVCTSYVCHFNDNTLPVNIITVH